MSGGRHIALGPAIAFAGLSIVGEGALAGFILRANRRMVRSSSRWTRRTGVRQHVGLLSAGLPRRRWCAAPRWPVGPYIDPAILASSACW